MLAAVVGGEQPHLLAGDPELRRFREHVAHAVTGAGQVRVHDRPESRSAASLRRTHPAAPAAFTFPGS